MSRRTIIQPFFIAAWRNALANRLQAAIAVFGLAVGLTAAILAGVVTVDAFTRDHFISGYDQIYFAVIERHTPDGDHYQTGTPRDLAGYLRSLPEIDAITREIALAPGVLRHGAIQAREKSAWVDPNFFRVYPVPALYGDLSKALERPDGMVITLAMARKYFGYDNVVGQTLELDHAHVMTITAVIADWPPNAGNEKNTVFASGLAPFSRMSMDAGVPHMSPGSMLLDGVTLVRLARSASLNVLNHRASLLLNRVLQPHAPNHLAMHFERVDELGISEKLNPGARTQLFVMETVALAILILSCVNFIGLSVARSGQRSTEVAIRKVCGATRRALIAQFLGESVLYILCALCLAIALVEWLLPAVNAFLQSGAVFDYWRDPALLIAIILGAMVVGLSAGAYPAFVLSAFRPAAVLKGWIRGGAAGLPLRQALVAIQFATLIVFLIAAATMFRQNQYATTQALGVDIGQTLIIRMPKCSAGLQNRIAALSGVAGAACSSMFALPGGTIVEDIMPHGGGPAIDVSMVPVGLGYFELYGLSPIAGRFFRSENSDAIPSNPSDARQIHYVINQEAARRLGYRSARAATGQPLNFAAAGLAAALPHKPPNESRLNGVIIGVVKDFSFTPEDAATMPGEKGIPPIAYSIGFPTPKIGPLPSILHVRLSGRDRSQTIAAIDDEWRKSGALDPIDRQFLTILVQDRDTVILKQGQAFAAFAGIAMLLAALGLFGVSQSATSRRTKEIGIRKAMGARDGDVFKLLLWHLVKPVLWANLIAWPLAWWAMDYWLSSFAYHVALPLWIFTAASLVALGIAVLTVAGQATLVARQKPVLALRYE